MGSFNKGMYISSTRSEETIFGSIFPLINTDYKGENILSISKETSQELRKADDPIEFELKNKYNAKLLNVKRYIVSDIDTFENSTSIHKLDQDEVKAIYPRFKNDDIKRLCEGERIWGIKNNNEIVCVAIITRDNDTFSEISIMTKGSYRRKGFGEILLSEITKHILDMNKLMIYVCEEDNIPSIKLIESNGEYLVRNEKLIICQRNPTTAST
jgi:GNAT superfamily N-acetyltransferase